jgi:hypothetical protein
VVFNALATAALPSGFCRTRNAVGKLALTNCHHLDDKTIHPMARFTSRAVCVSF